MWLYIIWEVDTGSKYQVSENTDFVKLRERSQRVCLDEDREGKILSRMAQCNLRSVNRSVLGNIDQPGRLDRGLTVECFSVTLNKQVISESLMEHISLGGRFLGLLHSSVLGTHSSLGLQLSSVAQSCLTLLRRQGLQHARLLCPSPVPRACSDSCPLSHWCHPTTSSSVIPFCSCLLSFPAWWVSFSHQVAKVLEFQLQHQSFRWIFRTDFLEDGLVWSPCSPRDSQESSPTPQFKSINSSALSFLHSPTLTSVLDY